ncbi:MAG: fatty acid desaturase [Pseudolabrys sp.]|nr:fatty acid desaturase [Pseudolabrys sp.]
MIKEQDSAVTAEATEARAWTKVLLQYREPNSLRSVLEIGITLLPLAALWALMWLAYSLGYWWVTLLLSVPAAGFLIRLFMIQHDCGHGAFFRHRLLNDWTGRALGVITFTPYDFWKRTHSVHHATSGNLEGRGMGDIDTLTVREYLAMPWLGRLRYRLYRHPAVMFGIGPAYLFIFRHRLPFGLMRAGWGPWLSTMGTNLAIAVIVAALIWLVGLGPFLLVQLPMLLLAAALGVWLFYVQHQFEHTVWAKRDQWNLHEAALHGSSYYVLPGFLSWFTANIGIHHVHHLCSKIPYYRLPRVLRENPALGEIGRLTLWDSIKCVRLVLWDESRQKLVSFREMRRLQAA